MKKYVVLASLLVIPIILGEVLGSDLIQAMGVVFMPIYFSIILGIWLGSHYQISSKKIFGFIISSVFAFGFSAVVMSFFTISVIQVTNTSLDTPYEYTFAIVYFLGSTVYTILLSRITNLFITKTRLWEDDLILIIAGLFGVFVLLIWLNILVKNNLFGTGHSYSLVAAPYILWHIFVGLTLAYLVDKNIKKEEIEVQAKK